MAFGFWLCFAHVSLTLFFFCGAFAIDLEFGSGTRRGFGGGAVFLWTLYNHIVVFLFCFLFRLSFFLFQLELFLIRSSR
ncbi:hypothetical protein DFH27DRAFT_560086 [Peziza echinospora]|nr:hypothetical protein DFH27DRAFT_560086 [Peziza echinospora]